MNSHPTERLYGIIYTPFPAIRAFKTKDTDSINPGHENKYMFAIGISGPFPVQRTLKFLVRIKFQEGSQEVLGKIFRIQGRRDSNSIFAVFGHGKSNGSVTVKVLQF